MPTTNIAPYEKQRFFDAAGIPLAGGKLFTYAAGSTTKQNSYTDSTGATPNTNPIILDAAGYCNLWLDQSLAYKLTLSPSTDTDPPTNPIWTVDQLNTSASPVLTALAASSGSSLVGFIQAGTGAGARTVQGKERDIVSITDFYANGVSGALVDPTGTTESSGGVNAALTAMGASGMVFAPNGTYKIGAAITLGNGSILVGCGRNATVFKASAAIDVISAAGSFYNVELRNFQVNGNSAANNCIKMVGTTQASAGYIDISNVACNGATAHQVHLEKMIYNSLTRVVANGGTNSLYMENVGTSSVNEGCIFYDGTVASLSMQNCTQVTVDKVNCFTGGVATCTQLAIVNSGYGNEFRSCTFEPLGAGLVTQALTINDGYSGAGRVNCVDTKIVDCSFYGLGNTNTNCIVVNGTTSVPYKLHIVRCKFVKPTGGSSILFTAQAYSHVENCVDLVTYDTQAYAPVTITNNSGNAYTTTNITDPASGSPGGAINLAVTEQTGTPSGTTTFFDIAVNVPSGSNLLGVQLRVDTALTAGETWSAAFISGSTTSIAGTGQAVAKNTKISKVLVSEITSAGANIRITRDAGNFTNGVGVILAMVYYEALGTMQNAP